MTSWFSVPIADLRREAQDLQLVDPAAALQWRELLDLVETSVESLKKGPLIDLEGRAEIAANFLQGIEELLGDDLDTVDTTIDNAFTDEFGDAQEDPELAKKLEKVQARLKGRLRYRRASILKLFLIDDSGTSELGMTAKTFGEKLQADLDACREKGWFDDE